MRNVYRSSLFALLAHASLASGQTSSMQCAVSNTLKSADKLNLTFLVDNKARKAYMIGNVGSTEVHMIDRNDDKAVSFIEITPSGNVMLTTIDSLGNAAHSRHTVIGDLVPSQFVGKCSTK